MPASLPFLPFFSLAGAGAASSAFFAPLPFLLFLPGAGACAATAAASAAAWLAAFSSSCSWFFCSCSC